MSAGNGFPLDAMQCLVDQLRSGAGNWRELLAEPRFEALRARERWFDDRQKGMFYRLLSPVRRDAFLEFQAGSGIVSACLAEDFGRGYALERRPLFAEFIRQRMRRDGISNVVVLASHGAEFQLGDGEVDLVAIDDPLDCDPEPVLSEARRCLRPQGRLIMAVDNAWCLRRPLTAAEFSGDSGAGAGRERKRSPPGYRRLLARSGFRNPRLFVVKSRRQLPIDIYSFHREALAQLYRKYGSRSRAGRLAMAVSRLAGTPYLAAWFQPSYYLVGDR